jgi:hypothetical protein
VQRRSQLRGDQVVTVDGAITSVLDTENFAEYEQNVYEKYGSSLFQVGKPNLSFPPMR